MEKNLPLNKRLHEKLRQKQLPPDKDAMLGKILTHKFRLPSKRLKIRIKRDFNGNIQLSTERGRGKLYRSCLL